MSRYLLQLVCVGKMQGLVLRRHAIQGEDIHAHVFKSLQIRRYAFWTQFALAEGFRPVVLVNKIIPRPVHSIDNEDQISTHRSRLSNYLRLAIAACCHKFALSLSKHQLHYRHSYTICCLHQIWVFSISIPLNGQLFPAEQWILAHLAVELRWRENRVSRWWLKHCHQTPYFLTYMLVSCVMSRRINLPMYQVPLSLWPHLERHNMFCVISQRLCNQVYVEGQDSISPEPDLLETPGRLNFQITSSFSNNNLSGEGDMWYKALSLYRHPGEYAKLRPGA